MSRLKINNSFTPFNLTLPKALKKILLLCHVTYFEVSLPKKKWLCSFKKAFSLIHCVSDGGSDERRICWTWCGRSGWAWRIKLRKWGARLKLDFIFDQNLHWKQAEIGKLVNWRLSPNPKFQNYVEILSFSISIHYVPNKKMYVLLLHYNSLIKIWCSSAPCPIIVTRGWQRVWALGCFQESLTTFSINPIVSHWLARSSCVTDHYQLCTADLFWHT